MSGKVPARLPTRNCKGFLLWNPGNPITLKALKPWKPATVDSWSFVTFEPWNPATLESCNPGALEPWSSRTLELSALCKLEPALGTLKLDLKQYGSLVKNFEPLTLWNCRAILPTLCSLYKLKQLYCVLRLLCIALVISLLMNQTKTLTSLEPWCLETWTLETWSPRTLVI